MQYTQAQGFVFDGGKKGIAQELLFRDIIANEVTGLRFRWGERGDSAGVTF